MDNNTLLQYIQTFTDPGKANKMGSVSIGDIKNMTINEFYSIKNRLLALRENYRYDTLVYNAGTAVSLAQQPLSFRNGINEQNPVANVPGTTYKQTRFHTNMSQQGNFGDGSLTICYALEYNVTFTALKGTAAGYTDATAYGANTNPLGVAPAAYDPALLESSWVDQVELQWLRDEQTIIRNKAALFPTANGISGVLGASVGGVMQNVGYDGHQNLLNNPQVFIDNQDFSVASNHLAPFDLTSATGLNIGFKAVIGFRTVEFRQVYP